MNRRCGGLDRVGLSAWFMEGGLWEGSYLDVVANVQLQHIIPRDFEPTEITLSYKQFDCNESELEANRSAQRVKE